MKDDRKYGPLPVDAEEAARLAARELAIEQARRSQERMAEEARILETLQLVSESLAQVQLQGAAAQVDPAAAQIAAMAATAPAAVPVRRVNTFGGVEVLACASVSPLSQEFCLRGRPGQTGPPSEAAPSSTSSSPGDVTMVSQISGMSGMSEISALSLPGAGPALDFLIAHLEADEFAALPPPALPIALAPGPEVPAVLPQDPPLDSLDFEMQFEFNDYDGEISDISDQEDP